MINKSESELRAMPVVELQKIVLDLSQIQPGDKAYPNAKSIIAFIKALKTWTEPKQLEVLALENVIVDGNEAKKGQTIKVYPWQYNALSRFLDPVKKAAALIALLFLLGMSGFAQSQYTNQFLGGLNGGTNGINTITTNYYHINTYLTNTIISPSVVVSNGTASITYTTNSTITTNILGAANITHFDAFALTFELAGTTGDISNIYAGFSKSVDGVNWQTNAILFGFMTPGTPMACWVTNYSLETEGYLCLDYIGCRSAGGITNLAVILTKKPIKAGP